jgi:hypothetical protein
VTPDARQRARLSNEDAASQQRNIEGEHEATKADQEHLLRAARWPTPEQTRNSATLGDAATAWGLPRLAGGRAA